MKRLWLIFLLAVYGCGTQGQGPTPVRADDPRHLFSGRYLFTSHGQSGGEEFSEVGVVTSDGAGNYRVESTFNQEGRVCHLVATGTYEMTGDKHGRSHSTFASPECGTGSDDADFWISEDGRRAVSVGTGRSTWLAELQRD